MLDGTTLTIGKGEYVVISKTGAVIGKGPYNGSDPNKVEMADWIRIDEINQLNAINARNYQAPVKVSPCVQVSFSCYNN
jgi:hypothetical protein